MPFADGWAGLAALVLVRSLTGPVEEMGWRRV
ncbi:hypothetical protein Ga0609869_000930 [Rhodovulum iodosum]|uniref:Uncharacterized protein n=1 Tax=Rhodovulum iodosum TaxID=68291 RepID=A0ABV3XQK4_9RHOB